MSLTMFIVRHVVASSFWIISTISTGLSLVNKDEAWQSFNLILWVIATWKISSKHLNLSVIGRKWSHHPKYSPTTPNPVFFLCKIVKAFNSDWKFCYDTYQLCMRGHLQPILSWNIQWILPICENKQHKGTTANSLLLKATSIAN